MAPVASPPIWASCLCGRIESASNSRQSPVTPPGPKRDERGRKKDAAQRDSPPQAHCRSLARETLKDSRHSLHKTKVHAVIQLLLEQKAVSQ